MSNKLSINLVEELFKKLTCAESNKKIETLKTVIMILI